MNSKMQNIFLSFIKLFLKSPYVKMGKNQKRRTCYECNFRNHYVNLLWAFLANQCHESLQSKNHQRYQSSVYSFNHFRLSFRHYRKDFNAANKLRVDCLPYQSRRRPLKSFGIFQKQKVGQGTSKRINGRLI